MWLSSVLAHKWTESVLKCNFFEIDNNSYWNSYLSETAINAKFVITYACIFIGQIPTDFFRNPESPTISMV